MYEDMNMKDMLSIALGNEMNSYDVYTVLSSTTTGLMRELFGFLAREEEKHAEIVRKLAGKLYPGEELTPADEATVAPIIADSAVAEGNIVEIIEEAMDFEMRSKALYEAMTEKAPKAGQRMILRYLAAMEQRHYDMLKDEMAFLAETGRPPDIDKMLEE